jgi:hypothetical protein
MGTTGVRLANHLAWRRSLFTVGWLALAGPLGACRPEHSWLSPSAASGAPDWQQSSFDRCVDALSSAPEIGAVGTVVEGLEPLFTENDRFHGWNVNKRYQPGQINIIVRDSAGPWPKECGVDAGYPTCFSRPRDGIVVCDPAMARLAAKIVPPFDSVDKLAASYLFAVTLGHELGHLRYEGTADSASHFDMPQTGSRLDCAKLDQPLDDLENRCDAEGIRLACPAIAKIVEAFRKVPPKPIPQLLLDPRHPQMATVWKALREFAPLDTIDSASNRMWEGDRLCLSSYQYESMTARMRHFSATYVTCVEPDNTAAINGAKEMDDSVQTMERILRQLQRGGWIGSGLYGNSPIKSEDAVMPSDGAIVFFAEGADQSVINVTRGESQTVDLKELWRGAGRIVAREDVPRGVRWFVLENGKPKSTLRRILVTCSAETDPVCAAKVESSLQTIEGGLVRDGRGRWAGGALGQSRLYLNDESLASGSFLYSIDRKGMPDVVFGNKDELVTYERSTLHDTLTIFDNKIPRTVSLRTGRGMRPTLISALAHLDGRLVFVNGGASSPELWDCPETVLDSGHASCAVHELWRWDNDSQDTLLDPVRGSSIDSDHARSEGLLRIGRSPSSCPSSWVVSGRGVTWMVRRDGNGDWLVPASGVAGCVGNDVLTFRRGRVDELERVWSAERPSTRTLPYKWKVAPLSTRRASSRSDVAR